MIPEIDFLILLKQKEQRKVQYSIIEALRGIL